MKIKTYLPIFKGYYGSIFDPNEDSEIDYINELRAENNKSEINYDHIDFDYNKYYLELSQDLCYKVWSELDNFINKCKSLNILTFVKTNRASYNRIEYIHNNKNYLIAEIVDRNLEYNFIDTKNKQYSITYDLNRVTI